MAYQPKSYRKFVATAATATLVATAVTPAFAASADDFTDVAPRYKEAVNYLVQNDIAQGINQKQFGVTLNIKRSDAAVMIAKALKLDTTKAPDAGFTDVPPRAVASVNALVEAKILSGKTSTKFGADDNLTRGEMALILTKAYKLDGAGAEHKFTDVAPRYEDAVKALVKNDITQGKSDTKFGTADSISRGEFAIFVYKAETKDELKVDTVSVATKDEVTTVSATVKNAAKDAEATVEIFANGDTTKPAAATQKAKVVDGKVSAEFKNLPEGNHVAKVTVDKVSKEAKFTVEAAPAAKVASVTAINAKQIEIKFNKAIDKKTVVQDDKTLVDEVLSFNSLDGKAVDANNAKAELSSDGKVLTLTAKNGEIFEGRYDVKVVKGAIKSTDGKEVDKYEVTIKVEDKVGPTISGTEKVDATTTKVNFSEPIMNQGNVSYKLADGTAIDPGAADTKIVSTVNGSSIEFELQGTKLVNKDVTVTFIGTSDFAGNLVNPNPATAVIKKGDKDGVAPTVKTVKFLNNKTLEVEFSENVNGFDASKVTVTGATVSKATQDTTNKSKYKVELDTAVSDIVTVAIDNTGIADLSGEAMAEKYTSRIVVSADSVKPTVQEAKVVKGNDNLEYLHLTFSEDVTKVIGDAGALSLNAKQYKDYITKDVILTATGADLVVVDDTKNQLKIKLSALKIGTESLVEGAKYTVDLPADLVADVAGNKNAAKSSAFEFTRGKDGTPSSSAYQVVNSVTPSVTDNNVVTVVFEKEVDGASATNKANYSINGAVIENATLASDEKTVTLKLASDSTTFSGDRYITINGVKTKAGVGLEKEYKKVISLNENIRPTVVSAKATGAKEITLTFSESVTAGTEKDFAVFFNNVVDGDVAGVAATAVSSNNKQLTITTTKTIDAAALNAGITVKKVDTIDVKDTKGNAVNMASPVTVTLN